MAELLKGGGGGLRILAAKVLSLTGNPDETPKGFFWDLDAATYSRVPGYGYNIPDPCSGNRWPAIFFFGGELYRVGGYNYDTATYYKCVYKYNFQTGTWTQLTDYPIAVKDAKAIKIGDYVYVGGGEDSNGDYIDAHYRYDPATDTWSARAAGATYAWHVPKPAYDGYAIPASIKKYDIATDTWSTMATPPGSSSYNSKIMFSPYNGKLYKVVKAGTTNQGTYEYDWDTDTWTKVADTPSQLSYRTDLYNAVAWEKLIISGQDNDHNDYVFLFDIPTYTWSLLLTAYLSNYNSVYPAGNQLSGKVDLFANEYFMLSLNLASVSAGSLVVVHKGPKGNWGRVYVNPEQNQYGQKYIAQEDIRKTYYPYEVRVSDRGLLEGDAAIAETTEDVNLLLLIWDEYNLGGFPYQPLEIILKTGG